MALSAWSIRNPIPVMVLFLALIIAGISAYAVLPIKQFPDTSFPIVQVSVSQRGAAPSELEAQVTRIVEDSVASIAGVKHVISTINAGETVTLVEFAIGEDEQRAIDAVRTAVGRIRGNLPRSIDEPIIERLEADNLPILTYAVTAPRLSEAELSWVIDRVVAGRLQSVPGVASVARVGGVSREINVVLRPDRLAALGLTAPAVNTALRVFTADSPGGRAEIGGGEQSVRVLGAPATVAALRSLTLPLGNGRTVRLSDVADIGDGAGEVRSFARLNGRPVVGVEVSKTKQASDVAVEDGVLATIAELKSARTDLRFTPIVSTVNDTRASYKATVDVLVEGMVLAAVVVFLFLKTWRSTVIAALAMPISLVPTFAVMQLLGFSLNLVTLLGLTLVIGILVDDAIVEIENIEKRIERGEAPYTASLFGADQIGLAVVATTLAIAVVFLPVSFMPGVAGQYFREFGLTVAVAVLFSLLVARLLTPLMTAYFLADAAHAQPRQPFTGRYRAILEWALARPWLSLLMAGLFIISSLGLASLLPTGFTPPGNPTSQVLAIEAAPGTTRDDMQTAAARLTDALRRDADVDLVFIRAGEGDFSRATATVVFRADRQSTAAEFRNRIRPLLRSIPGVRVSSYGENGAAADVELNLAGPDGPTLDLASEQVERALRRVPILANVRPESPPASPELLIRPRIADAARLGVNAGDIAEIARIGTIGDVDANVARFSAGDRQVPIRAILPDAARRDLAALEQLAVPTASGGSTRLASVADIGFGAGPGRISRFDRERRAVVRADLRDGATLGDALAAIEAQPELKALPRGVRNVPYGDAEALDDLFGGFVAAMLAGVGMIVAVLVLLFRSFFKPVTILTALPLSLGGAFAALLLTNLALTLPALIGLLMLLGLAAKNSILLVEFAIEQVRDGMSRHDALIEACRERARPIIMTTIAMAAGMLPTALGLGEGAEFRQPMAIGVIGGLISSTALSLVLVPVFYVLVDRFELWLAPRLSRLITQPPSADQPADRATINQVP